MWWIKLKLRQLRDIIINFKMLPDLKLRTFVVVFSTVMMITSFFLGLIIGRRLEAEKSIIVTNSFPHVAYDESILKTVNNQHIQFSEVDKNFVASISGKVYYPKDCKGYSRIKEENRVWFKNEILARASGYALSKNCNNKK